jgi:hypothetical protein
MKKFSLKALILVFLLIISYGIQAQNVTTSLDQFKLQQQFIGTWQASIGKDTVEIWECHQNGKAFTTNVYQVIRGQKTPLYNNYYTYSPEEGKTKGFAIWNDGGYVTWIGLFTTDKKSNGSMLVDFNPGTVIGKYETIFKNPNEWTWIYYNKDGIKMPELQFVKIK